MLKDKPTRRSGREYSEIEKAMITLKRARDHVAFLMQGRQKRDFNKPQYTFNGPYKGKRLSQFKLKELVIIDENENYVIVKNDERVYNIPKELLIPRRKMY